MSIIERIGRNPLKTQPKSTDFLDHVPAYVVALKTAPSKAFIEGRVYKVSSQTVRPKYSYNTCFIEEDEQGNFNHYAFGNFRPATAAELPSKNHNQVVRAIKDELYGRGKNLIDALKEIKNDKVIQP